MGTASDSIRAFSKKLRRLPVVIAQQVAASSAPAITEVARATFDAGETPDGVIWAPGVKGQRITLRKSGAMERALRYVAVGTKLRVALGVRYAKYQIGKRPVFPRQGELLPEAYSKILRRKVADLAGQALQ
jgi:hypothetical protein